MQKLFYHPITLIAVTILAVVFFLSLDKSAHKAQTSISTIQDMQQDTNQLSQEVNDLTRRVEGADSPLSQEKLIRDQLLMQKPGESVIQIPAIEQIEDKPLPPPAETTPWHAWREILSL